MIDPKRDFDLSQSKIDQLIESIVKEYNQSNDAIYDGIADFEAYSNSPYKVAWILKEPYDDFENGMPIGGGWSIPKDCFLDENQKWKVLTWQRVIYVMYGLKYQLSYSEMDFIRNDPEMGKVLREVAWINLSKMPALTSSDTKAISYYYKKYWRPVVLEQVKLYSPKVIVFGNTLQCCREDFLTNSDEPIDRYVFDGTCFINVYKKDGKTLLDAYHPGFRSIPCVKNSVEHYVDSLIDAIKKNS